MFTKNIFFKNFNVKKKNFRVRNILSNLVNEQNHILFSLSKNYKNSFDIKKIAKYKKFSQFCLNKRQFNSKQTHNYNLIKGTQYY